MILILCIGANQSFVRWTWERHTAAAAPPPPPAGTRFGRRALLRHVIIAKQSVNQLCSTCSSRPIDIFVISTWRHTPQAGVWTFVQAVTNRFWGGGAIVMMSLRRAGFMPDDNTPARQQVLDCILVHRMHQIRLLSTASCSPPSILLLLFLTDVITSDAPMSDSPVVHKPGFTIPGLRYKRILPTRILVDIHFLIAYAHGHALVPSLYVDVP